MYAAHCPGRQRDSPPAPLPRGPSAEPPSVGPAQGCSRNGHVASLESQNSAFGADCHCRTDSAREVKRRRCMRGRPENQRTGFSERDPVWRCLNIYGFGRNTPAESGDKDGRAFINVVRSVPTPYGGWDVVWLYNLGAVLRLGGTPRPTPPLSPASSSAGPARPPWTFRAKHRSNPRNPRSNGRCDALAETPHPLRCPRSASRLRA